MTDTTVTNALPLFLLIAIIAAFFALARGHYAHFGIAQRFLRVVVVLPLLLSAILLHFLRPGTTASIIPPAFPSPYFLVLLTGFFEIAGTVGLFMPRFRRPAALSIAIMMVAVFPANIYAAGRVIDGIAMPSVSVRTALQIIYILLVLLAGYGIPMPVSSTRN